MIPWRIAVFALMLPSVALATPVLPPGQESAIETLVQGAQGPVVAPEIGDIHIESSAISVHWQGAVPGELLLLPASSPPRPGTVPLAFSPSFSFAWQGQTPPPTSVRKAVTAMIARDHGGFWHEDLPSAPPSAGATRPAERPTVPWSLWALACLWLLAATLSIFKALLYAVPRRSWAVPALGGAVAAALATVLLPQSLAISNRASVDAIAGRGGDASAVWSTLLAWHFHIPQDKIAIITVTFATLVLGSAATSVGRLGPVRERYASVIAGILIGSGLCAMALLPPWALLAVPLAVVLLVLPAATRLDRSLILVWALLLANCAPPWGLLSLGAVIAIRLMLQRWLRLHLGQLATKAQTTT